MQSYILEFRVKYSIMLYLLISSVKYCQISWVIKAIHLFGSTIYKAGLSWFCFLFSGMHENNLFFFTVCIS